MKILIFLFLGMLIATSTGVESEFSLRNFFENMKTSYKVFKTFQIFQKKLFATGFPEFRRAKSMSNFALTSFTVF